MRKHLQSQGHYFNHLREIYKDWKNQKNVSPAIPLPDLLIYPKGFPFPNNSDFLVRDSVLEIFKSVEGWDMDYQKKQGRNTYGWYLAGPFGVGNLLLYIFWLV